MYGALQLKQTFVKGPENPQLRWFLFQRQRFQDGRRVDERQLVLSGHQSVLKCLTQLSDRVCI